MQYGGLETATPALNTGRAVTNGSDAVSVMAGMKESRAKDFRGQGTSVNGKVSSKSGKVSSKDGKEDCSLSPSGGTLRIVQGSIHGPLG